MNRFGEHVFRLLEKEKVETLFKRRWNERDSVSYRSREKSHDGRLMAQLKGGVR